MGTMAAKQNCVGSACTGMASSAVDIGGSAGCWLVAVLDRAWLLLVLVGTIIGAWAGSMRMEVAVGAM
jgi:hypothetical protein